MHRASSDQPPSLQGERFVLDDAKTGRVQGYVKGSNLPGSPMILVHTVNAAASAYEIRPLFEHYGTLRPTFSLDLPGYGLSDRSRRTYTPRLMTDAIGALVDEARRRHPGQCDALAASLGCEFLARAAGESPGAFRTVAFVSPTGFDRRGRRDGPPGSTRAMPRLLSVLSSPLWDDALFNTLTRPSVVRYFLEKTFGSKTIDEGMWAHAVTTSRAPGAKHAPLHFLSGHLFSNDVTLRYEALDMPVWMSHGDRGDFVDYRGKAAFSSRPNWHFHEFETGALPFFEKPSEFIRAYDAFLASPKGG